MMGIIITIFINSIININGIVYHDHTLNIMVIVIIIVIVFVIVIVIVITIVIVFVFAIVNHLPPRYESQFEHDSFDVDPAEAKSLQPLKKPAHKVKMAHRSKLAHKVQSVHKL